MKEKTLGKRSHWHILMPHGKWLCDLVDELGDARAKVSEQKIRGLPEGRRVLCRKTSLALRVSIWRSALATHHVLKQTSGSGLDGFFGFA